MSLDLTHYHQQNNDYQWIDREDARLTEAGRLQMMEAIYRTLREIPEGKFFDIGKRVKSENHELFVKTCCEFIDLNPDYRLNRNCTLIHNDPKILMPIKNATDEQRKERQRLDRERRRLPA